jgi:hypothetical protein
MAQIDPNNINRGGLDPNTRYAYDVEQNEAYSRVMGSRGSEGEVYGHAKVLVVQPQKLEALKVLMGESKKRRWAYFDLPKNDHPIFLYDAPEYRPERLEANIHLVSNIDCSCPDKEEEMLREQEKSVILSFCESQLERKKDYDHVRARILEFLQG